MEKSPVRRTQGLIGERQVRMKQYLHLKFLRALLSIENFKDSDALRMKLKLIKIVWSYDNESINQSLNVNSLFYVYWHNRRVSSR